MHGFIKDMSENLQPIKVELLYLGILTKKSTEHIN